MYTEHLETMIDVDWWANISMIGSVSMEQGPPLTAGKPPVHLW
jgi:hypothetical protein